MAENPGLFTLTRPVVMIFPNLFEPRQVKVNGKPAGDPKYGASFMFSPDNTDLAELKKAVAAVARAKWPGRELKGLAFPLYSGDKMADNRLAKSGKDDGAFQRGKVIIKARSKYQPRLSAIVGGKLLDLDGPAVLAHKNLFFFGSEVLTQFNFVAYSGIGNNPDGVNAYLNMVLTTGKGTKLGSSGQTAAEAFAGYIGHSTDYDPTGGQPPVEDDIPF